MEIMEKGKYVEMQDEISLPLHQHEEILRKK